MSNSSCTRQRKLGRTRHMLKGWEHKTVLLFLLAVTPAFTEVAAVNTALVLWDKGKGPAYCTRLQLKSDGICESLTIWKMLTEEMNGLLLCDHPDVQESGIPKITYGHFSLPPPIKSAIGSAGVKLCALVSSNSDTRPFIGCKWILVLCCT